VKEFPGLKILAILLISIFIGACATDKPPTGGPPDKSPLSVAASYPESGAVNVSPQIIRLDFSHFVSRGALMKSIFFSPIVPDYDVTIRGKEADIRLYSPLKPGRTYTLTLQKTLKGFYGQQLERSWTLAFSTGPVIDKGTIDGKVWTNRMAPASNITVMAFAPPYTNAALPDSLAPLPDYIAQTDPAGNFRFDNLGRSNYRLIAINDKNGNLRFANGKEEFGVPSAATVETGTTGLAIRLASGDNAAIALLSCRTINDRELEVTFSNNLVSRRFDVSAVSIKNVAKGTSIPVLGYFTTDRAEEETTYRLLTGPMSGGAIYRISFAPQGMKSKPSELTFTGEAHSENYPELSLRILPTDKTVNLLPELIRPESGPSVELQFNLPVVESSVEPAVTLTSIRKTAEQSVPYSITRSDNRTFSIHPSGGFEPGLDYRVDVRPGLVTGLVGSKSKDVRISSRFSIAGPDQYGEISGTGTASAPAVIIDARHPGSTTVYRTIARPSASGAFSFSLHSLPPGDYTVFAFIPTNPESVDPTTAWKSGSVRPFVPSEPFSAVTVNVRPGWTTENIRLDVLSSRPYVNVKPDTVPPAKRKRH
jgi:hypothetical protein